uniref:Uncharacterized protein n=1 Tax=Panagrellus redivivus TaxID=6233 RepID=A0A7E4ULG8_PANRE
MLVRGRVTHKCDWAQEKMAPGRVVRGASQIGGICEDLFKSQGELQKSIRGSRKVETFHQQSRRPKLNRHSLTEHIKSQSTAMKTRSKPANTLRARPNGTADGLRIPTPTVEEQQQITNFQNQLRHVKRAANPTPPSSSSTLFLPDLTIS